MQTARQSLQLQKQTTMVSRPRTTITARRASTLVVRAAGNVPLPKGVTLPPRQPISPPATFGFVDFAEKMNSRAAMIGFFSLLAVEGIFGKGILEMVGVTIGKGLDIGF